jgi:Tfp pilus assembly protein FimT
MNGLTAIELLIITSIIAVIAVFAAPMLSAVFFESDLDKAEEITEETIKKARIAARFYNSDVTMRISASGELARHGITITIPRAGKDPLLGEVKEEFSLPVTVRVMSGDMLINFNSDGEVDFPTMVMMSTNEGNHKRRQLVVE